QLVGGVAALRENTCARALINRVLRDRRTLDRNVPTENELETAALCIMGVTSEGAVAGDRGVRHCQIALDVQSATITTVSAAAGIRPDRLIAADARGTDRQGRACLRVNAATPAPDIVRDRTLFHTDGRTRSDIDATAITCSAVFGAVVHDGALSQCRFRSASGHDSNATANSGNIVFDNHVCQM